jgi:hypothetical protein
MRGLGIAGLGGSSLICAVREQVEGGMGSGRTLLLS